MARTADQMELGIVAEKFTEREKKIRALLREYRTIDRRIEYFERLSKGDGLSHEPRITAAPPVDEHPFKLMEKLRNNEEFVFEERDRRRIEMAYGELSENQYHMITVLRKYLGPAMSYATCARVADKLSQTFSDDTEDDEILQMAFTMFKEASAVEERVELTSTERDAIIREQEINQARQKLATLREHKRHVGYALDTMREYYEYEYWLLWWRYVEGKEVSDVCKLLRPDFELTRDEWINHRRKAMHEFSKWVPIHLVGGAE